MSKKDYYDFQIQYLENNEYDFLNEEDKKNLLSLRNLNRRRKQHERWIKKNQRVFNEFLRREKLLKEIKKEERNVFDEITLLKKDVIPILTIYKKDETSKSKRGLLDHYERKTYKGEPLKKREVWYCQIRMKTKKTRNQKNIYLGNTDKLEGVLNTYFDENKKRGDNTIKFQTMEMLMGFFITHLKDGWDEFQSNTYPFNEVIIPYLMKDIKKGSFN